MADYHHRGPCGVGVSADPGVSADARKPKNDAVMGTFNTDLPFFMADCVCLAKIRHSGLRQTGSGYPMDEFMSRYWSMHARFNESSGKQDGQARFNEWSRTD